MVCALEEKKITCVIQYKDNFGPVEVTIDFPRSSTVADLYEEVGKRIRCHHEFFNLVLQQGNRNENAVSEFF